MNILVSQVSDLEARNRSLESRAHQRANDGSKDLMHSSEPQSAVLQQPGLSISTSSERVQVQVSSSGSAASTSSSSSRPQEVTVRVEVRAEGDVAALVTRVLVVIRETGRFTVVSVDASRPSDGIFAQATFTLRAQVRNTTTMLFICCRCIAFFLSQVQKCPTFFKEKKMHRSGSQAPSVSG
jgi:hypothetical protein